MRVDASNNRMSLPFGDPAGVTSARLPPCETDNRSEVPTKIMPASTGEAQGCDRADSRELKRHLCTAILTNQDQ